MKTCTTINLLCGAGKRVGSARPSAQQAPEEDDFIPFRTNYSLLETLIGQILVVLRTFPSRTLTRLMHGGLKSCWRR